MTYGTFIPESDAEACKRARKYHLMAMADGTPKAFPLEGFDPGMDLRDYFAAKAMQALFSVTDVTRWSDIPEEAYLTADQMMKARELPVPED